MLKKENVENFVEKSEKIVDGIYIHIPFCNKKCEYCDFCTFINMSHEYEYYCKYIIKEINLYKKNKYDTIYFGGGTPSLLPTELIKKILDSLDYDKKNEKLEITLELNPNDMKKEKLKELKEIGINRLSIGIQSFQNEVLKFIGREHSGEDAIKTFYDAREVGFDNISIDLMFAIPNQSMEDLKRDLEIIKKLNPENISIYSLIWEEGTVFFSKLQKGILKEMDQDLEAEMYEYIIKFLKENGYVHYEISNFCKPKKGGKHNVKYWKNKEFIGVGLSASSYYDGKRYSNVRNFYKYYKSIDENKIPIDEKSVEIVDEIEEQKLEKMLGLRLVEEGIKYFENEKIEKLLKRELIEIFCNENNEKRLRLTEKGIELANEVFVEFI